MNLIQQIEKAKEICEHRNNISAHGDVVFNWPAILAAVEFYEAADAFDDAEVCKDIEMITARRAYRAAIKEKP